MTELLERARLRVSLAYGGIRRAGKVATALIALAAPAQADPITIAALGDSLTQGYGLPRAEGFVPQMEAWLNAHGADVTLINAGVSGDTTAGGLSRIDWTLTPDVDGVIVALGGNDLLRGLDPDVTRANLDQILTRAQAAGVPALLIPMEAIGNYGPDYKAEFDAIYTELAQKFDIAGVPPFLRTLGTDISELAPLMQPDGIHPNAQGVAKIVEGLGPIALIWIDNLDP